MKRGLEMKSEASAGTELNPTSMKNAGAPPQTWGQKLKMIGPGFVVAATGVGTADMITAIVIGTSFGMTFVWAIIVGAILKYF